MASGGIASAAAAAACCCWSEVLIRQMPRCLHQLKALVPQGAVKLSVEITPQPKGYEWTPSGLRLVILFDHQLRPPPSNSRSSSKCRQREREREQQQQASNKQQQQLRSVATLTPLISSPRAATSVANMYGHSLLTKDASAASRSLCCLSPCTAQVEKPVRTRGGGGRRSAQHSTVEGCVCAQGGLGSR